jgi:AcrR family transcriptional regulator
MNQDDRRVRRSRRLLGEALLHLLQNHEFGSITVRAVTEAADVGYMTFYRHYNSLEDLLVDRIRCLVQEQLAPVMAECDQQGPLIFEHLAEHEALYRTLLFSSSAAQARQKLERLLVDFFLPSVKTDTLIPRDLRARHMAAGVLALAGWWFETGKIVSIDQVAEMYNHLILDGNLVGGGDCSS